MRHQHARGERMPYRDAPVHVRGWVDRCLGSRVATVTDCVGGMSPGPAARVRSESGARAFVKACGPELNPQTPQLLRAEGRLLGDLPASPALPTLLDRYDDGDWVVLLIEELPGAVPQAPWARRDLDRAQVLLTQVRPVLDAAGASWVPRARDSAPIFTDGWQALAARLDELDPWWTEHHDELARHAVRAAELIDGDALLHWDVRADNLILSGGRDVLIDWGQARRGADWIDRALLAMDCALSGAEVGASEFFAADPVLRQRDPADLVALMSAEAMTLAARSTEQAPPGLPTLPATRARWALNLRDELSRQFGDRCR